MTEAAPPGHVGNLNDEQTSKLREFWIALFDIYGITAEQGVEKGASHIQYPDDIQNYLDSQSPAQLRSAFWHNAKHDHPDAILLRYLRARKWDVQKALNMLLSMLKWRTEEVHLDDDIMANGEAAAIKAAASSNAAEKAEGEGFMLQLREGKSFMHGVDKEGRPICWIRARLHHKADQTPTSLERYAMYNIEIGRLMVRAPVQTASLLFDLTGFGLGNMDYEPIKFMAKTFEANYPESLGLILVHRAPWIFQACWMIIRGWLDPVVASKVHFTKNAAEMSQFVDLDQIPKAMGGDEQWEYSYTEPFANENSTMDDQATKTQLLEERDVLYKRYEDAIKTSWTTGDTFEERNVIATELRDNYWRLDPYLRARSVYDRTGFLDGSNPVNFRKK